MYRRQCGAFRRRLFRTFAMLLAGLLMFGAGLAHGSVAVLLEEPYGGMARVNPTGHSAVYLDHVCAESPTVLRPCREGELGVVISRYDGIHGYDWLAVPIVPYLYAVDSMADMPETADRATEFRLRDAYRRAHLLELAPDLPDGRAPEGNWYELVGSAYDRTLYGFQVKSTAEQDAALIALFNDRENVERYNGAFRNCADFTRVVVNRFYPHAIRRNFIADFGLSTPKSVARALTHYASKHPETGFTVFKVAQVKGNIPRSKRPQGVSESLFKKYGVPLFLLSPSTTAVVVAAYFGHGRFSLPKDAPELALREPAQPNGAVLAKIEGASESGAATRLYQTAAAATDLTIPSQIRPPLAGEDAVAPEANMVTPTPPTNVKSTTSAGPPAMLVAPSPSLFPDLPFDVDQVLQ